MSAQQSAAVAMQLMSEQSWDCAALAYSELQDEEGLYQAWSWAQGQRLGWTPSLASSYASMAEAVTRLHSQPQQGVLRTPFVTPHDCARSWEIGTCQHSVAAAVKQIC